MNLLWNVQSDFTLLYFEVSPIEINASKWIPEQQECFTLEFVQIFFKKIAMTLS